MGNGYNLQNSATTKKHQNRTSREDMRPNMSFGWSGDLPADSATRLLHRSMIAKTKWGSLAIPVCFFGVNLCQDDIMPGWTKVWAWILWTWVKFDYWTNTSTSLVELDTHDCNLNSKVRQKHCSEILLPFRATEQQKGSKTYKLNFTWFI